MTQSKQDNWHNQVKSNTLKMAYWTGAWLVTLALATFGPIFLWQQTMLSHAATIVNLLVGIGMLVANHKHLQVQDELQQKIQLEAMALTLGVVVIVGMAYGTIQGDQLLNVKNTLSNLMFIIGITYLIGVFIGRRKYQ
ncbi:hypothetical protein [Neptunicella sp.]|uniref:hypothetical protein n=1 Tax=Neptunicella sp. TaxID=2125986 RepID=UPI003F6929F8